MPRARAFRRGPDRAETAPIRSASGAISSAEKPILAGSGNPISSLKTAGSATNVYLIDGASVAHSLPMTSFVVSTESTIHEEGATPAPIIDDAAVPAAPTRSLFHGMLVHLRCLRWMVADEGWIRTLLEEAENERMHLMTFIQIARPSWFERVVIVLVQAVFFVTYFLLYLVSARTAHRLVGYFEEQAVISYTLYLAEIDAGRVENVSAPAIAVEYWNLPTNARLRDVVVAVRADEVGHRDVNHAFANALTTGATFSQAT